MAETAAGGCVRRAARSAASNRPCASASGTSTAGSGWASASTRLSASATLSNAAIGSSSRPEYAGLAAALLDQSDPLDVRATLDRLDHVVNGEARDRHRGQRFHLDAGVAFHLHGRADDKAWKAP